MFYSPITSIFRIFYEINGFKDIQNGGSKMADQNGGYLDVKNFIVTSLLLLMTTFLLLDTRILSDMLLLRLGGYTSNSEEILIK